MMEGTTVDVNALEARAKLQLRVHRTLLKHQLMMAGNALLVAFLFAALLVAICLAALSAGLMDSMVLRLAAVFGVPEAQVMSANLSTFMAFRIFAVIFLLCPGLGLRICGSAMKP